MYSTIDRIDTNCFFFVFSYQGYINTMGIQWRSEPSERIHQRFLDGEFFLINFWLRFRFLLMKLILILILAERSKKTQAVKYLNTYIQR